MTARQSWEPGAGQWVAYRGRTGAHARRRPALCTLTDF